MGGGTTFSASPATVNIPTGSTTINIYDAGDGLDFTVPAGIHVLEVTLTLYDKPYTAYVGVTPNSSHVLWPQVFSNSSNQVSEVDLFCVTHSSNDNLLTWLVVKGTGVYGNIDISWSPKINTHTPTVTDY